MAITQKQIDEILGRQSIVNRLFEQNQPTIQNTPNPASVFGGFASVLKPITDFANRYEVSKKVPLLGGQTVGDVTGLTGARGILEDISYGYNPVRGANLQTTKFDPRLLDLAGILPMAGAATPALKAGGKAIGKEALRQIETGTGLLGQGSINPRMNIVPVDVAKNINMPVTLPQTEEFLSAVKGTPNASITPEGLQLSIQRFQKPEQELSESVRTGVFYLPEGSANVKNYKGKGTTGGTYGGTQAISGETLYKNPLLAKGATGGKVPEEAYKQLVGKEQFNSMQSDLMKVLQSRDKGSESYMFLEKYAPDIADNAWNIVDNSKQGNQLRYALQEAVIANEARNAGYDSILGYSKGRGDKGNFLSEIFDLRESNYPSSSGEFYLNPEFEGLLGK